MLISMAPGKEKEILVHRQWIQKATLDANLQSDRGGGGGGRG